MTTLKAIFALTFLLTIISCSSLRKTSTATSTKQEEALMPSAPQQPSKEEMALQQAKQLQQQGKFNEASALLVPFLTDSLQHTQYNIVSNLEELYYASNQLEKTLPITLFRLSKEPQNKSLHLRKASTYRKLGMYNESINAYIYLCEQDSTNSTFVFALADLYEANEQPTKAPPYYIKGLELNNNSVYLTKLMKNYLAREKGSEALKVYNRYYDDSFETNRIVQKLYAKTLFSVDSIDYALETTQRLLAQGDSSKLVLRITGTCLLKNERYKESNKYLERYFEKDLTNSMVSYMIGCNYAHLNKQKEAIDYFMISLALLDPLAERLSNIHTNIALMQESDKEYKKAYKEYELATQIFPKNTTALYRKAITNEHTTNNIAKRIDKYKEYIKLLEKNPYQFTAAEHELKKACKSRIAELKQDQFWK